MMIKTTVTEKIQGEINVLRQTERNICDVTRIRHPEPWTVQIANVICKKELLIDGDIRNRTGDLSFVKKNYNRWRYPESNRRPLPC